jgi:hypothetical protein
MRYEAQKSAICARARYSKNLSHELHGLALIFCTQSVKIGEIRGKIVLGIARFNCKSAKAATTDYASLN